MLCGINRFKSNMRHLSCFQGLDVVQILWVLFVFPNLLQFCGRFFSEFPFSILCAHVKRFP